MNVGPQLSVSFIIGILYYVFLIGFIATYYLVFRGGKDVALKRKWWPRFLALFVVFTAVKLAFFFFRESVVPGGPDKIQMMVILAAIAAMVFFRLKNTKFCDKCSALVRGRVYKSRSSCPKCGTQLAAE